MTKKFLAAIAIAAMSGCSEDDASDTRSTPDATTDATAEAAVDSGGVSEASTDAGTDSTSDSTVTDAPADTTAPDTATTPDTATASDSASDGPVDSADVSTDAADGGTAADCIDASAITPFFTLMDDSKCLVAAYDVATGSLGSLTWGRHGGPLGFNPYGTKPQLVRYQVPSGTSGTLTPTTTDVTVPSVPAGVYWGSQAVDLPFFGWTAIGYTGTGAAFPGEVVLVGETTITRYDVNGFFSVVGVGGASSGRMIHTSVSPISDTTSSTNAGGLYAADTCGSLSTTPALLPGSDATCKAPIQIGTWQGGSSGPVAADPNDNVFAILSKFGGKQELRAFEKSTVARGAAATDGTTMFAIDGFTGDMVADGKAVYFQPNDATTYSPLDVQYLAYTTAGTTVAKVGSMQTFLKLAKAGTTVSLVRDDRGRIWAGVTVPGVGDAGPTSSKVFVFRAKMP